MIDEQFFDTNKVVDTLKTFFLNTEENGMEFPLPKLNELWVLFACAGMILVAYIIYRIVMYKRKNKDINADTL